MKKKSLFTTLAIIFSIFILSLGLIWIKNIFLQLKINENLINLQKQKNIQNEIYQNNDIDLKYPTKQEYEVDINKQISLLLNFDETKFKLIKPKNENRIYLVDKKDTKDVFLSWYNIYPKDLEIITQEEYNTTKNNSDERIVNIENSQLNINSSKISYNSKTNKLLKSIYFIDDGVGGIYKVIVNNMCYNYYSRKEDLISILDSINIVLKSENPILENISIIY